MGRIFCPQRGLTHIALVIELVMLNFYLGSSQQLFGVRYFCEALTVLFRITPDY
jgi:hypothetical protein